jgi:serine/threonine protein kinase
MHNFPNCKYIINSLSTNEIKQKSFKSTLEDYFLDHMDENGHLDARIELVLSRQSICEAIAKIAEAVANFQAKGKIHGDLKPKNILLTKKGPRLIDDFNLNPGKISPGWTEDWSAPEQALQLPLSYSADVYPLGFLILKTLGGRLLGEVRKFIIPTIHDPKKEHNIFYNPSVLIDETGGVKSGKKEWKTFIESCLKFDSTLRPKTASEFLRKLSGLLEKHPLVGDVKIGLDNGRLVAATLLDGSKTVAKMISD